MATNSIKDDLIRVRVSKEDKEKLKNISKKNNITISEIINKAIQEEIKNYEFKEKNYSKICSRAEDLEKKLQKIKVNLIKRKSENKDGFLKKLFKYK